MTLDEYRAKMDEIDDKLVRLLEQRMDISREISDLKTRENMPTQDMGREQYKLYVVSEKTGNPLYKEHMKRIFEAIMEQSRKLQDSLK
ncbi:MAG: chorismate mutase [Lachnospiraceae bacterium]|nr:chorismate mutase [Lachnospiraceae bacterium]